MTWVFMLDTLRGSGGAREGEGGRAGGGVKTHLSTTELRVRNDDEVTDDGVLRDIRDGTGSIEDSPGAVVAVNLRNSHAEVLAGAPGAVRRARAVPTVVEDVASRNDRTA